MKKFLLLSAFFLSGFIAMAQPKDSTAKARVDTLVMIQYTDTVKADYTYATKTGNVMYAEGGYVILKGYATPKNKKLEWTSQPAVIGALDEKKKVNPNLKKIIQLF